MSKLGNSTMDSNMALVLATLEAGGRLADLRRSLGCGSVTVTTIRAAGTLCLHWRGVALGGHLNNLQGGCWVLGPRHLVWEMAVSLTVNT